MIRLSILIISLFVTACASTGESIGLGAATGGTIGALIGNQAGEGKLRDKQTLQGAAIGAGLGALIGYAAYKGKQEKQNMKIEDVHLGEKAPSLTAPKVRRVWVPAQIEGEKFIEGHYMYVIEKTSTWSN